MMFTDVYWCCMKVSVTRYQMSPMYRAECLRTLSDRFSYNRFLAFSNSLWWCIKGVDINKTELSFLPFVLFVGTPWLLQQGEVSSYHKGRPPADHQFPEFDVTLLYALYIVSGKLKPGTHAATAWKSWSEYVLVCWCQSPKLGVNWNLHWRTTLTSCAYTCTSKCWCSRHEDVDLSAHGCLREVKCLHSFSLLRCEELAPLLYAYFWISKA